MTDDEIEHVKNVAYVRATSMQQDRRDIINAGLRHACDNGQVVPREEFNTVADEMNHMRATFRQVFGEEYRPGMVIKVKV